VIRSLRLRSEPIDPGASVVLTCPLRAGERALHLDIDLATRLAFEIQRAEKTSGAVHIEVRCRANAPTVFHGALLVERETGARPAGGMPR